MNTSHKATRTRLYNIWKNMRYRCQNQNWKPYENYGARGIAVCDEWNTFTVFQAWALSNGYKESLELDRNDVNGNYEPSNCRWLSHHEQTLNRRDTLYVNIDNKSFKLRDFCEMFAVSIHTVNNWRHLNLLDEKLSERIGKPVTITGGKKEVISV